MPIPDFQSLMLPILEFHNDKLEHVSSDVAKYLKEKFTLTDKEISEPLPSGRQAKFANRVGWATIHLMKAGLLNRPSRGKYIITPRGLDLLKEKPNKLSIKSLERFPEYLDFREARKEPSIDKSQTIETEKTSTPQELIEASVLELQSELADSLLKKVLSSTPEFFEQMVIDLLIAMGYGGSRREAGKAIGRSHDGGVDGKINEDKLGLDEIYIQAKRWNNTTVGSPEIHGFIGSLVRKNAVKGIFITTSKFSQDAREAVKGIDRKVVLIDGKELTRLLIEYNIGVSVGETYTIKRIDSDYFEEE